MHNTVVFLGEIARLVPYSRASFVHDSETGGHFVLITVNDDHLLKRGQIYRATPSRSYGYQLMDSDLSASPKELARAILEMHVVRCKNESFLGDAVR